ncbi:hypothetical protein SELMODRAFT_176548 [Selaginella moellendorffii]|uniref:Nudix hydrolase domain-containing protein n=1 Tax=Selaginella moellendorffii TaxID=88036 RepID=D8S3E0_SELML|nr:nudix hydrolase 8 [Selaginella moellendorffii]EFJ21091.1 hypothetical protein SELMODRAFT_176548 [Selaginella moellendorffii]|eukprot:XP_002977753.1 nudix hydrolase 8 [Selaginella moellendorffii]
MMLVSVAWPSSRLDLSRIALFAIVSSPPANRVLLPRARHTAPKKITHRTLCVTSSAIPLAEHSSLGVAPLPIEDEVSTQDDVLKSHQGSSDSIVFRVHEDRYNGVIVDPDSLPADVPTFVDRLERSLASWREKQKRGVWLKLPIEKSNLVPHAIEAGFRYHHAEPTYLMLTHWLADSPCTLPANASHQVGIGAFVVNDRDEVLAVQEKNGPLKGTGIWKMPTGLINQAEDIFAGAIREVKEETGIDTEFVEVVGFRQGHHVAFEKSDLFFVCVLRPLSSQITKQDSEIEDAKWMPLSEFGAQDFFQSRSMLKKILEVCIASKEKQYSGFGSRAMSTGFQRKLSHFYFNTAQMGKL